ncbi:MAG: phage tail protein [Caulobacteraceae bacterium]
MPIAVFSNKVFAVTGEKIYSFNGFQYSSSLETEKQDSAGKKPSTYNKGSGLDNMSFKIPLNVELGVNPRKELEDWRKIKNAGVAYPFILGSKPFGENKWLLISVEPVDSVIDNFGNIISCELDLKFEEYVRPGSAKASNSAGKKNSPGISLPPVSGDISILAGADKARVKRQNSGMLYDI